MIKQNNEGPKFNRLEEDEETHFECHVAGIEKVENIKCNVSTFNLHKKATDCISLRVRIEFHIPIHTLYSRNQFPPNALLKKKFTIFFTIELSSTWLMIGNTRSDNCDKIEMPMFEPLICFRL